MNSHQLIEALAPKYSEDQLVDFEVNDQNCQTAKKLASALKSRGQDDLAELANMIVSELTREEPEKLKGKTYFDQADLHLLIREELNPLPAKVEYLGTLSDGYCGFLERFGYAASPVRITTLSVTLKNTVAAYIRLFPGSRAIVEGGSGGIINDEMCTTEAEIAANVKAAVEDFLVANNKDGYYSSFY